MRRRRLRAAGLPIRGPAAPGFAALGLAAALALGAAAPAAAVSGPEPAIVRSAGPAVVRARTAALLLSGLEGGEVPTALLALPLAAGEGAGGGSLGAAPVRTPVLIVVEIDGRPLAAKWGEEETGTALEVEVFLYALEAGAPAGSEVAAAVSHRLILDPVRHGELLTASGVKLLTAVELAPGSYDLRLLVQSPAAEAGDGPFGLRGEPLTVPGAGEGGFWISEAPDRWLLALPAADERSGAPDGTPELAERFVERAGSGGVPAALPVLGRRESWSAWRWVSRRSTAASRPPAARFTAGGMDGEGEVPDTFAGTFAEVPDTSAAALGALAPHVQQLVFDTPRLPPGRYRLQLVPGEEGVALPRSLPVWVTNSEPAPAWPRLETMEPLAEPAPIPADSPSAPPPVPLTTARLPAEEVRAGYREALSRLAADPEAAAAAVAELEARAFDPAALESAAEIEVACWQVLTQLVAADPEAAPPVVELHIRRARERSLGVPSGLRELSGRLAARLAETYAEAAGTAEARRLAARALAILAGDAQEAGRGVSARGLFRRALAQDGDEPAALLGLAIAEEQAGRPAEAVVSLERLVGLLPRHSEARLRLAVNLLRRGETRRGRQILGRLAAETEPAWIVSLAHQELARSHLREGDCEAAEGVLRRASRRWPEHVEIAVQLSYALECQGRRPEARRLAAEVVSGAGSAPAAASDRTRYTRAPLAELEADRRWLGEEARLRGRELARALEQLPEPALARAPAPGSPAGEG